MSGEVEAVNTSTEECCVTEVSPTLDDVHRDAIGEIKKGLNSAASNLQEASELWHVGGSTEWDRAGIYDGEILPRLSAEKEEEQSVSHELPPKFGSLECTHGCVEICSVLDVNNDNLDKQPNLAGAEIDKINDKVAGCEINKISDKAGDILPQHKPASRYSRCLSNLEQLDEAIDVKSSPVARVGRESEDCHREQKGNCEDPLQFTPTEETKFDSSEPGPSGLHLTTKQKTSALQSESDSGSCDSVIIIEKPKKQPVMIVLSDDPTSSEDDELVYVRRKRKSNITQGQHSIQGKGKGARNKSRVKQLDPIKERLEGKKSEIFELKPDPDGGRATPTDPRDLTCAICLGEFENQAFLDQCFHSFCFACILQWAEVVKQCPLCKTEFKFLIHTVTKDLSYHQHFFREEDSPHHSAKALMEQVLNGISDDSHRFQYRSTMTTERWRQLERQQERRQEEQRRALKRRRRYQKSVRHREAASVERRRMIYRTGMEVKEVKTHGRPRQRDISVEFMQRNPAVTHRLVAWLLRDIRVLVGNNDDHVNFLMHFILSLVTKVAMDSEAFYDQLVPFFAANTRRFIQELISFAQSPYDVEGYDSNVVYALPETGTAGTAAGISTSSAPIPGGASADLTHIRGTDSCRQDIASGVSLSSEANQGQIPATVAPERACSSEDEISVVRVVPAEDNAPNDSPWNLRKMIDRYHDKRKEQPKRRKEGDLRHKNRRLVTESSSDRKEEPRSPQHSQDPASITSKSRSSEEWLKEHHRSSRTENMVLSQVCKESHSRDKETRSIRSAVFVPSQVVDSPLSAMRSRSSRGRSSCAASPIGYSDSDLRHLHPKRRRRKHRSTSRSQTHISENSPNSNSCSGKTSRSSSGHSSRKRNLISRSQSRSRSRSRSRLRRESRRRRRRKTSSPRMEVAVDESSRPTRHISVYSDASCGRSRAASGSSGISVVRSTLSSPLESFSDQALSSVHGSVHQCTKERARYSLSAQLPSYSTREARGGIEDSELRGRSLSRSSEGSSFVERVQDNVLKGGKNKDELRRRISPAGELHDVPVDSDRGTESMEKRPREARHHKRKKSKSHRKRQSRTQSVTEEDLIRSSDRLPSNIMLTNSTDSITKEVNQGDEPSEHDLLMEIKRLEKEIRKRRRMLGKVSPNC